MAEMPSHIASSGAQAGYQAREIARGRDQDRASQAQASHRQAKAADESDTTVETSDSDTAVFTNSEGAGSQGRAFESDENTEDTAVPDDARASAPDDGDDQVHLDLEA